MGRMGAIALALGIWFTCFVNTTAQPEQIFDFSHVSRAIQYLEDPSSSNLQLLAETDAMKHLKRHSDQTGYYPLNATQLDIASDLAEIKDTRQFLRLIEYLTFLEGTAVYAAYDARRKGGGLTADPDYVALESKTAMKRYNQAYFQIYQRVEKFELRPLTPEDWSLLDNLSDGDRLWYRVGALMAETICRKAGQEVLQRLIREGPLAFFAVYRELTTADQN